MISARLKAYFEDYATCHKTKGNQITHIVGIPMIIISLLGLLAQFHFEPKLPFLDPYFRLDGGSILIFLSIPFYLYLDWKIAIPYELVLAGFYLLGRVL